MADVALKSDLLLLYRVLARDILIDAQKLRPVSRKDSIMVEPKEFEGTGTVICFTKGTIDRWLENFLACLGFSASLYIGLKYVNLLFFVNLDPMYHAVAYISFMALISVPLAFRGLCKNSVKMLLLFLVILWYHIYCIFSYIYLNIRHNQDGGEIPLNFSNFDSMQIHQVVLAVYSLSLLFCLLLTIVKTVSIINQIEPSKVAIMDNSLND